jgi:hypothetical protein
MARDLDTGIVKPTPVIVDEQTKAAGMRAAAAAAPAAAAAIAKTPDELMIDRLNAAIATTQTNIAGLQKTQAEIGAVNPAVITKAPGETNSAFNARVKAAEAVARANLVASDPMYNKSVQPTAPTGYKYTWIGGTDTGSWQLYKLADVSNGSSGNGNNGNGNNGNGNGGSGNTTTDTSKPVITDATKDAFAALTDLFSTYGLGSLAGEIAGYMTSGLTASEALIKLKTNPNGAYAERFAGNFARAKKGLNVISEAAYIDLENSYAETLKAYGLGNMLSTDSKQNAKQFASYIENDISAVEFKDRINTVQQRVVNADPAIKAMFKEFYPSLTNSDLVSYFLNPTETIGKLKEKVTSAEIGAAFTGQGLTTSLTSASDLARYGIDRAGALEGAANIADVLPGATKLGNIYGETGITYNQQTGEQEFLKSSDEAKRKRNLLASKERASFDASAGNAPGAYSTGYLKRSSTAGLI